MDLGDTSSQNPGHGYLEAAALLAGQVSSGSSGYTAAAAAALQAQMNPSAAAYSALLGQAAFPHPAAFGGLGLMPDPLRSPTSALSPTTGLNGSYGGFQLPNLGSPSSSSHTASPLSHSKSRTTTPSFTAAKDTLTASLSRSASKERHRHGSSSSTSSRRSQPDGGRSSVASRTSETRSPLKSPPVVHKDKTKDEPLITSNLSPAELASFAPGLFGFPGMASSASQAQQAAAAASMFMAPSLYPYPFPPPYASQLYAASAMMPGYPPYMPPFGAPGLGLTTATTTTTAASPRTSSVTSPAGSTSSTNTSKGSSSSQKQSKKQLFPPSSTPTSSSSSGNPESGSYSMAGVYPGLTRNLDLPPVPKLNKIPSDSHDRKSRRKKSSPKKMSSSGKDPNDSLGSLSDDSLGTLESEGEDDKSDIISKSPTKQLSKEAHSRTEPRPSSCSSSASSLQLSSPDHAQDLSIKKSSSSSLSSSLSALSSLAALSNSAALHSSDQDKVKSNEDKLLDLRTGHRKDSLESKKKDSKDSQSSHVNKTSTSKSSDLTSSAYLSQEKLMEQQLNELYGHGTDLSMAYSIANSAAKQAAELYAASKMPPHMFMHPAAAAMMMPPGFLDSNAASLFMPPPSSSSTSGSSSSGGRGRVRGKGKSRSDKNESASSKGNSSLTSLKGRGRGRGRPPGKSKGVSRGTDHQQELRLQLEAELERHNIKLPKSEEKVVSLKVPRPAGTNKLRYTQSKLAQALMGQSFPIGEHKVEEDESKTNLSVSTAGSSGTESDSDESEAGSITCDKNQDGSLTTAGEKRKNSEGDSAAPEPKKGRKSIDEKALKVVLDRGWKRRTHIQTMGPRGLVGEVTYLTECEKKLKNYPEVLKFLEKSGCTDLKRENFSFSCNVNVGEFFETRKKDGKQIQIQLTDDEVIDRFMAVQLRKEERTLMKQERAQLRQQKKQQAEDMARKVAEARMQKKLEQQEMARRIAEMKIRRKLERQQAREMARQSKQLKAIELQKMKEQQRLMKEQQRIQKQEQLRIEKEAKAHQIEEMRRKSKELLEQTRASLAQKKAQEREQKRQQAVVMKEQERERKRQHILLVKALENRKKQEEKIKQREEKLEKQRREKQRRDEQKRIELLVQNELKKPVEDMILKDSKELPEFDRITGVCLSGSVLADALMIIEFTHNFKEVLNLDDDMLPTMTMLQGATQNDEDELDNYMALLSHLTRVALNDPGFNTYKEGCSKSGCKLIDLVISDTNVSEALAIFMRARNGKEDELSMALNITPVQGLSGKQKVSIMAFVCNELLSSKSIMVEIDRNIESIGNLRRDKWMAENRMRKFKMIHAKKYRVPKALGDHGNDDVASTAGGSTKAGSKRGSDDEDSGHESDVTTTTTGNLSENEEEDNMSKEDLEKRIEKCQRQMDSCRQKVNSTMHKLRALDLGEDRYKRHYWVLPHCGGLFIEGQESSTSADLEESSLSMTNAEVKQGPNELLVKTEIKDDLDGKTVAKMEIDDVKAEIKQENGLLNGPITNGSDKPMMNGHIDAGEVEQVESKLVSKGKCSVVNGEQAHDQISGSNVSVINKLEDVKSSPVLTDLKNESVKNVDVNGENLVNGNEEANSSRSAFKVPNALSKSSTPSEASPKAKQMDMHMQHGGLLNNIHKAEGKSPSNFRSIESMIAPDMPANLTSSPSTTSVPSPHTPQHPSTNGFFSHSGITASSTPLSAEQMLKNLSEKCNAEQSWFSILPRVPCDEASLVSDSCSKSHAADASRPGADSPFLPRSMSSSSLHRSASFHCSPSSTNLSFLDQTFENTMSSVTSLEQSTTQSCLDFSGALASTDAPSSVMDIDLNSSLLNQDDINMVKDAQDQITKTMHREPKEIPKAMLRGWWRCGKEEQVRKLMDVLHQRGIRERNLRSHFEGRLDFLIKSVKRGNETDFEVEESEEWKEIIQSETGAAEPGTAGDDYSEEQDLTACLSMLEEVECLEERVGGASLQVKTWTIPGKITEDDKIDLVLIASPTRKNQRNILEVAKSRILAVEGNIERRYLKQPFSRAIMVNLASYSSPNQKSSESSGRSSPMDDSEEESIPPALMRWREAVNKAESAAQISICLSQLNKCIAWEKSIMKVSCQICTQDDNEAELLLCDSCDKGYHTYCFKPVMVNVPTGDWYCFECISKATGETSCVRCGKKSGRLLNCDKCPRRMHLECIEPALARAPRRYRCKICDHEKGPMKRSKVKKSKALAESAKVERDRKDSETSSSGPEKRVKTNTQNTSPSKTSAPNTPVKNSAPNTPSKNSPLAAASPPPNIETPRTPTKQDVKKELVTCKLLQAELEKHDNAWPFLSAVNTKQFPTYRKIIKTPMDLHMIGQKLKNNCYKSKDDFAEDSRLVFQNCKVFNEDDSEVGRAGQTMKRFFEKRWKELFSD